MTVKNSFLKSVAPGFLFVELEFIHQQVGVDDAATAATLVAPHRVGFLDAVYMQRRRESLRGADRVSGLAKREDDLVDVLKRRASKLVVDDVRRARFLIRQLHLDLVRRAELSIFLCSVFDWQIETDFLLVSKRHSNNLFSLGAQRLSASAEEATQIENSAMTSARAGEDIFQSG